MIVLILSDVHGDIDALEHALADGAERGATRVACLGDVVDFVHDRANAACVRRLAILGEDTIWVRGDHDRWLTSPTPHPEAHWPGGEAAPSLPSDLARRLHERPGVVVENEATWAHAHVLAPDGIEGVAPTEDGRFGFGVEIQKAHRDAGTRRLFVGHTHTPYVAVLDRAGGEPEVHASVAGPVHLGGEPAVVNPGGLCGNHTDGIRTYALWDDERDVVKIVPINVPARPPSRRGTGWWISPTGTSYRVPSHDYALRAAPERYGFAPGTVPADRVEAMSLAMRRGWTRVRFTQKAPHTIIYDTWQADEAWHPMIRRHLRVEVRPEPSTPLWLSEFRTGRIIETSCGVWLAARANAAGDPDAGTRA